MNWNDDPHTCWTISLTVSNVHLKNFSGIRIHDLCAADAVLLLTEIMKPLRCEQVYSWTHVFLWKKCLWSVVERWIEKMILTAAGKSQLLSHMCTYDNTGIILVFEMNEWIWSWDFSAALAVTRNAWTGFEPWPLPCQRRPVKDYSCIIGESLLTSLFTFLLIIIWLT